MKFTSFLAAIPKIKNKNLGGINSQMEMAPAIRRKIVTEKIKNKNIKTAAVLVLFYPNKDNETCIVLTQRANYKGTHSKQISFPGGKQEPNDINLWQTSNRETMEEIGVDLKNIHFIKELTKTYIPPSNFWVHPFIGYVKTTPKFTTNYEVASMIELKLSDLQNDKFVTNKRIDTSYMKQIDCPCFKFENHIVWGATAMMLNEVKELLKEA